MAIIDVGFDLGNTQPGTGLTLSVWFDGTELLPQHTVDGSTSHRFPVTMQPGAHQLVWRMQGKTAQHTKISPQGTIEQDAALILKNISLADVLVDDLMARRPCYHHDYNGHGAATCDTYHGIMGCNGEIRLDFYTPLYMWLLDHR